MSEIKQEYTGTWLPAYVMLNEKIKPIDKLIYAEIASFRQCFMSNKTLSARVGVSERTIITGIQRLEDAACIIVHRSGNYRICINAFQAAQKLRVQILQSEGANSAHINNNINKVPKGTNVELRKIFDDLIAITNQPKAKPLPSRLDKLRLRLKTWTKEELKSGARGMMNDPFMTGENDHHKVYATIDYLLANDTNVEKRMGLKPNIEKKVIF